MLAGGAEPPQAVAANPNTTKPILRLAEASISTEHVMVPDCTSGRGRHSRSMRVDCVSWSILQTERGHEVIPLAFVGLRNIRLPPII